ncbi:hypothetical protein RHMOL_Rhmol06G0046600 [Rhododendron molle]|uniref:Uncharacterized protein n=1 Tax=Rhododendron molle TaxID=49168 RepID=A0ACC0N965_RHOML|nr:hypothetical protein RHMOL_Rhmol06G0046600 [Rhododendron molle]
MGSGEASALDPVWKSSLDLFFDRLLEFRPCESDQNDMIERGFGFRLFVRLERWNTGYGVYYCDQDCVKVENC